MCTNITSYIPVRRWFDEDEEEQWGYGYRDDTMANKILYNKNFTL